MSEDRIVHSVNDINGRSSHPVRSHQSVWMSHWMRTACNVTAEKLDRPLNASGNEELNYDNKDNHLRHELDIMRSGKGLGMVETRTSKTMNDGWRMSTEIIGNKGFGSSIFKHHQETYDPMQGTRPMVGHHLEQGQAVDIKRGFRVPSVPSEHERNYNFLDEGTSKHPFRWMKTNSSAEGSSFAVLKPLQETYIGLSSQVPYKLDLEKSEFQKGKSEVLSLISEAAIVSKTQLQNTNLGVLERERCSKDVRSADLVCERKRDGPLQLDNSANGWYRDRNTPFLFDIPSTSDHHYAAFNQEFFHKMQKHSGLGLSPNQCIDSGKTETTKSFYDCCSLNNLQNFQNVETVRICTTVEEGIPGGYPRLSQTSRRFLITEKTDVNMLNEFDVINTARVITKIHGNKPSAALHSVSPFKNQGKGGVILQPLSSSTDSEGIENAEGCKISKVTINNESSAETHSMDVEIFKEKNPHSGANSTPSEKALKMDLDFSHKIDVSSKEAESQRPYITLPDINLELPALPVEARSWDDSGPSSSKTQSLEMDMLVAHAEQSPKRKSNIFSDNSPYADPSINRWVKRLKLSSSQSSAQSPKISNLAENSSNQKKEKYIGRTLMNDITGSEPTPRKHYGREAMVSEKRENLSKDNEELMEESSKKNKELLLSGPWIRRWLHDGSRISLKNNKTTVVSEPQSPSFVLEDLQKKQFPSIGAMALMGKAMRGFQPCDPQKKGSFNIWNTKAV